MSVEITNVMAVSLDGLIGKHALESDLQRRAYDFTNEDDKEWVRSLLTHADAVVTGANSLRAAGQAWEVKNDQGRNPSWVVLTNNGLDEALPFWKQHDIDRVLVSSVPVQSKLCELESVENLVVGNKNTAAAVVKYLESKKWNRVLMFGGGVVNNLFYEAGLVDFAKITLCPLIIGGVNAPRFVEPGLTRDIKMSLVSSVVKGSLLFLTYKIHK